LLNNRHQFCIFGWRPSALDNFGIEASKPSLGTLGARPSIFEEICDWTLITRTETDDTLEE
jgi:hypothetical protein